MAKRGYKLQEFVAHSTNVNCLSIGKKACRMFITGGDDHKVNLWAIGKPTSLMSLCGHTSPVESVAFDTAEVLVLGGASSGAIKLWDLEESKMVRTLTGHRSNCTAVEFHPFGEFFASGSTDTNLKIWDIRKKGCIHTYKGHSRSISTIRFTPDGRWVVSGGFDNVVKVWDLTAGKLLHDFKFHEGHISSLDFHPLEFLLATGSADKTVKFWDLETFELIGSARPEASGVRSITFHPDGRTLFCGLEDSLKVYSWEPVICHDAVDIGWSTLSDLCIHEQKLLGCSYYQNSVAVWVADISLIEPYGVGFVPDGTECVDKTFNIPKGDSSPVKLRTEVRSASDFHATSPDYEIKEIKNIYVDSTGGNPVSSQKVDSLGSPKMVFAMDPKDMSNLSTEKKNPMKVVNDKAGGEAFGKSSVAPAVIPRDSPMEKNSSNSGRETVTFSKTKPGMLLRPAHVRKPSNSKNDVDKLSAALEPVDILNMPSKEETAIDLKLQTLNVPEDRSRKSCEEKASNTRSNAEKFEKDLSPEAPYCDESTNKNRDPPVKIVNGVAVVAGRTRSLVERFERRERFSIEDQSTNVVSQTVCETYRTHGISNNASTAIPEADRKPLATTNNTSPCVIPETKETVTTKDNLTSHVMPEMDETPIDIVPEVDRTATMASAPTHHVMPEMDIKPVDMVTPHVIPETKKSPNRATNVKSRIVPEVDRTSTVASAPTSRVMPEMNKKHVDNVNPPVIPETKNSPNRATNMISRIVPEVDRTPTMASAPTRRVRPEMGRASRRATIVTPLVKPETDRSRFTVTNVNPRAIPEADGSPFTAAKMSPRIVHEVDKTPPVMEEPQISGRDLINEDINEDLMQTHDVFLSILKSRLTKLQVVRHFWERNDIKGAINALRKLPDHSVQTDVISCLMEKMEILTLDLFSCLLPVLVGLLDSKMERHISVSLEMLLKLVAVFGPVVHSTISAPPVVGVDLHAEQRLECCNQCNVQLVKIQQSLPALISKGGLVAKSALELNLVIQQS